MRIKLFTIILLLLCGSFIPTQAQQNQVERTTSIPYAYPHFQKAVVTMLFGSEKNVEANIYLDGAQLYFKDKDTSMVANIMNVRNVKFSNGDTYMAFNDMMEKLLAEKDGKMLLEVTMIDRDKMKTFDTKTGKNKPTTDFSQIAELTFLQAYVGRIGSDEVNFPLKTEYYFYTSEGFFPAKPKYTKPHINSNQKDAYKAIMLDRFWSWNDAESLKKLLELLK